MPALFTSSILLCILKENFQKPTRWIFRFFSSFCHGALIQISFNSPPQEYEKYPHF